MLPNSRCCRCELRFGLSARAFAANEQVRNVRIADVCTYCSERPVPALVTVLIDLTAPSAPFDLFEDQFRHNDFPIGAFQQVVKTLIRILFTPMYDGRDLASDKLRLDWWCECF